MARAAFTAFVAGGAMPMPSYFVCEWHHDLPDEPVLFYEEQGDDRMELRRVEEFRDSPVWDSAAASHPES